VTSDAGRDATAVVRDARDDDVDAISALLAQLGYPLGPGEAAARLARVRAAGDRVLVADAGGAVAGVAALHLKHVLHRPRPVGVLTVLVVDERARGAGLGATLVAAAEHAFAARGCGVVEVASHRARARAHAFYERLGYEPTSLGFRRTLR
jgi:GNAT superfamily N-acetyltransferase